MIIIDEVLISDDVIEKEFACAIDQCKGACCWEGDYGAPLENEEIQIIETVLEKVLPYLDEEAKSVIQSKGWHDQFTKKAFTGTQLMPDGACVFLTKENGVAFCSFEKAYLKDEINFRKPISCHLYPIRVEKNNLTGFEALNYDKWEICSAACTKGKKEDIHVYEFAKDAIIRKYGAAFYQQLDEIAKSE